MEQWVLSTVCRMKEEDKDGYRHKGVCKGVIASIQGYEGK